MCEAPKAIILSLNLLQGGGGAGGRNHHREARVTVKFGFSPFSVFVG